MSLKYQLENLDGVEDVVKGLYEQKNGKFVLGIDGLPDVAEYETRVKKMDAKINELLDEKKTEATKRKEAEEATRLAAEEAARKDGDVAALEKSWQDKLAKSEQTYKDDLAKRDAIIDRKTRQAAANELAASLAVEGSAKTLLPHIQSRLKTEFRDGEAVTVVLDATGKPSAMTVEELGQEIAADPAFAPIIVASKASGGGAKGTSKGGGAASKTITRKEYDAMEPAARQKLIVEDGVRITE
jgi:hypothetical protein